MVVGGVAVSRHNDSGIILEFKGWYALLNEHEVEIKRKNEK